MRSTAKGQVTIPQAIRERAGLMPGSEVEVWIGDDGVVRLGAKPGRASAADRLAALYGRATGGMSTDEILALTRE